MSVAPCRVVMDRALTCAKRGSWEVRGRRLTVSDRGDFVSRTKAKVACHATVRQVDAGEPYKLKPGLQTRKLDADCALRPHFLRP